MHRVPKQALGQAVKWEIPHRNPADAVDPPKVERAAMNTFDLLQTAELVDALRGTRMLAPTLLAVLCGLRRGELAALRWKNVDLAGGQIAVVESAEETKAGVRYKEPKSGRARTVALSALCSTSCALIGPGRRRTCCCSASGCMTTASLSRRQTRSR